MTHDDHDAGESLLAGIDLHAWRVPPPATLHRPSLLVGALSPATPPRRPRLAWLLAALVLFNAAIAAIIVIVLTRSSPEPRTVVLQPAGGGSVDAQVRDLLQRLEVEQRELEQRLAEINQLRALVIELSEKVRQYEEDDARRERTVPHHRDRSPVDRQTVDRQPVDPYDNANRPIVVDSSCDEVSCVLSNNQSACCARFRVAPPPPSPPGAQPLPDGLTREMISTAIASVKARVAACGDAHPSAKGKVKARIRVAATGRVTNVTIDETPDAPLAACVAAVLQRATFEKTLAGGSFSYPFVF